MAPTNCQAMSIDAIYSSISSRVLSISLYGRHSSVLFSDKRSTPTAIERARRIRPAKSRMILGFFFFFKKLTAIFDISLTIYFILYFRYGQYKFKIFLSFLVGLQLMCYKSEKKSDEQELHVLQLSCYTKKQTRRLFVNEYCNTNNALSSSTYQLC